MLAPWIAATLQRLSPAVAMHVRRSRPSSVSDRRLEEAAVGGPAVMAARGELPSELVDQGGGGVDCGGGMPSKVGDAYVSEDLEFEQEHAIRDW